MEGDERRGGIADLMPGGHLDQLHHRVAVADEAGAFHPCGGHLGTDGFVVEGRRFVDDIVEPHGQFRMVTIPRAQIGERVEHGEALGEVPEVVIAPMRFGVGVDDRGQPVLGHVGRRTPTLAVGHPTAGQGVADLVHDERG